MAGEKILAVVTGELLFTHYRRHRAGRPAAQPDGRLSSWNGAQDSGSRWICSPGSGQDELAGLLGAALRQNNRRSIKNALASLLPARLLAPSSWRSA